MPKPNPSPSSVPPDAIAPATSNQVADTEPVETVSYMSSPHRADDDWNHREPIATGWRLRYLIARLETDDEEEAAIKARVSKAIVERETRINPTFAIQRQEAIARTLTVGLDDSSRVAREGSSGMVVDAMHESRTDKDGRVRVANRRLVLETAGAIAPRNGGNQGQQINNWGTIILQLQQQRAPSSDGDGAP